LHSGHSMGDMGGGGGKVRKYIMRCDGGEGGGGLMG
jgi:hypothetical protein